MLSSEKVYRVLKRRILSGQLPEGQRLAESALGRELGLSRVPVREALSSLVHDGLVAVSDTGRCYVTKLSRRDFQELFDLRLALEGTAAQLSGPFIRGDASALEKNIAECNAVKTMTALTHNDLNFHEIILEASGNKRLLTLWLSLRNELELWLGRLHRSLHMPLQETREATLHHHRKLLECLRTQGPAARELEMRSHIQTWREWLTIEGSELPEFDVLAHAQQFVEVPPI
jgi:DNA-binding GntR family transcriptional regulator